jgi:hypothetical protein
MHSPLRLCPLVSSHFGASIWIEMSSGDPQGRASRPILGFCRVVDSTRRPMPCGFSEVMFELRRLDTGGLVHRYETEGAALAFVRDVVRVGGHERAACFALVEQDSEGGEHLDCGGVRSRLARAPGLSQPVTPGP